MDRLLEVIEKDNEENAILAIRIIQDLVQKNMASTETESLEKMEKYLLQQFKDFKLKYDQNFSTEEPLLYRTPNQIMTSPLNGPNPSPTPSHMTGDIADSTKRSKLKMESKDSFKVVAETYLILVLVMGLYSKRPKQKITEFVPHIVEALKMMPPKEIQIRRKEKFADFMLAQNKMYSILGYLLRIQAANEVLQTYSKSIADSSIIFLKACPQEPCSIRKTFLGTLKFLIISYVDSYLDHFKDILNYDVLLGENNERQDLRADAAPIILNVVQYTKEKLSIEQRELIIHDLLRMINDITITLSLQSNAVLALNKYIDVISKMTDSVILFYIINLRQEY